MSSNQPLVQQLAEGTGIGLVGRFAGRFLSLMGDIIVARILGPAVFGLYSIGLTIFRLAELISPLGNDVGVLRFGAQYYDHDSQTFKGVVVQSIGISLISGIVIGGIVFWGAPWLATVVFNKPDLVYVFRILAFGFPVAAVLPVVASATRITQIITYSVISQDLGQPTIGLVILIILYLFGLRLSGVLISTVLSYGLALIVGFYYLYKLFPSIFHPPIKPVAQIEAASLFSFSMFSSLVTVFSTLIFWVDRLLIGYFLSSEETGLFQAASQLSVIFVVVLSGVNRIVIPMFVKLYQDGRHSELEEIYRVGTKWGIYFSVPAFLVLLFSSRDTLSILYGTVYATGATVMVILLVGQFINLATGAVGPLLVVTGNEKLMFGLTGATLVLNILLDVILIPQYKLMGASVATAISLLVLYTLALIIAKRKLDLWPYDRRYYKGIIATLGACIPVVLLRTIHPFGIPLLTVIFQGIFAYAIFFPVLLALQLDYEDREFIITARRFFLKDKKPIA